MSDSFNIDQKQLSQLLASMQPICSKKTTLDVTESVLFHVTPKELIVKATDLEISLQSSLPIESNMTENRSFLISGKRIFELVKEIEGEIELLLEDTHVQVKAEGVDLQLNIRPAEDFPPFPERIENLTQVDAKFLLSLLSKVSFVVPSNNSNAALNGVLFELDKKGLTLVATDGHCLAEVKTTKYHLENPQKWLLPKRAVLELKKLLEGTDSEQVFLGICASQLVFSGQHFNFFTKLLGDPFPQYKPVLDKEGFLPARISKHALVKTLKRTNCLLAGQFLSTNFVFRKGASDISLQNKEVGKLQESVELQKYTGNKVVCKFFSPYIISGLNAFSEDEVDFHIKNDAKPILFESNHDDYQFTYLVMPVSAATAEDI